MRAKKQQLPIKLTWFAHRASIIENTTERENRLIQELSLGWVYNSEFNYWFMVKLCHDKYIEKRVKLTAHILGAKAKEEDISNYSISFFDKESEKESLSKALAMLGIDFNYHLPDWTIRYSDKINDYGSIGMCYPSKKHIDILLSETETALSVFSTISHEVGHALGSKLNWGDRFNWMDVRFKEEYVPRYNLDGFFEAIGRIPEKYFRKWDLPKEDGVRFFCTQFGTGDWAEVYSYTRHEKIELYGSRINRSPVYRYDNSKLDKLIGVSPCFGNNDSRRRRLQLKSQIDDDIYCFTHPRLNKRRKFNLRNQ